MVWKDLSQNTSKYFPLELNLVNVILTIIYLPVGIFFSDKLLVLYQGTVVEEGLTSNIFRRPKSKYSKMLLKAASIKKL